MANVTSTSFPRLLWSYYVDYLWNYHPESNVARVASVFRILALVLILPILVLSLLDVSSYVIARTLGIVDDVKASTSDRKTLHTMHPPPSIRVDSPKTDDTMIASSTTVLVGGGGTPQSLALASSQSSLAAPEATSPDASPPEYFTSEGNNLKLSGFDVFSPAPSQPPSPTLSRQQLPPDLQMSPVYQVPQDQLEDGIHFRRRKRGESK
ncbi:hypothetical protein E1B28_000649 [Marasmius oreades]|uniref:Transmembrane protein n=1 Tax=Marasmius oreades TaxID=181124 RepID=A0A9P7V1T4_9AGAR|nr:uncharacterized protein E1B28_000649 [Marasmius oreades]KAG7098739.1 hypothetical protein E1B28_000649 [Marasmius oreades]